MTPEGTRQVLSMTSGYQDFWPQDYVMPGMLLPAKPEKILDVPLAAVEISLDDRADCGIARAHALDELDGPLRVR